MREFQTAAERLMHFGYEITSMLFLDLQFGKKMHLQWDAIDEFQKRLQLNFFNASSPRESHRVKEVRLHEISRDFGVLKPFAELRLDPEIRRELSTSSVTEREINTRSRTVLLRGGIASWVLGVLIPFLLLLLRVQMTPEWIAVMSLFLFAGIIAVMGSGHPERLSQLLSKMVSTKG